MNVSVANPSNAHTAYSLNIYVWPVASRQEQRDVMRQLLRLRVKNVYMPAVLKLWKEKIRSIKVTITKQEHSDANKTFKDSGQQDLGHIKYKIEYLVFAVTAAGELCVLCVFVQKLK